MPLLVVGVGRKELSQLGLYGLRHGTTLVEISATNAWLKGPEVSDSWPVSAC